MSSGTLREALELVPVGVVAVVIMAQRAMSDRRLARRHRWAWQGVGQWRGMESMATGAQKHQRPE